MKGRVLVNLVVCLFGIGTVAVRSQACIKGQVDLLFIVDSSTNVGADDFNLELRVATNLAENLYISPDAVQIGALTFSDNNHILIDFNSYFDFIDIEKALDNASYLSGSANTFTALQSARDFFIGNHGGRSVASRVAVVFTNGRSSDPARTAQEAALLRNIRVHVIVVGLSNSNSQELLTIASGPQDVFQIGDFDSILHSLQGMIDNTCNVPCTKGELDILFVLDSSSSVGNSNFEQGLRIAANLAENFHIGADSFQFAALTFASYPYPVFNFSSFTNYIDVEKALVETNYLTGITNTSQALEYAESFFDGTEGDRIGAPNVAVVFTNGMSSDPQETANQATLLKQSGVYVIAVGYSGANTQELENVASNDTAVFDIINFNGILKALQDYSSDACDLIA